MSLIYEKYLTALADEQLVIDCPKMLLTPYLEQTQGKIYEGSGSILQTENGELTFKLYASEVESFPEFFPFLDISRVGKVIEDARYYNLTAFDIDGRKWLSKKIDISEKIYIDKTSGRSYGVITGELRSIRTTRHNSQFLALLALWWKWYVKLQNDQALKPKAFDLWCMSLAYCFLNRSSLSLWFLGDIKLPFNTKSSTTITSGDRVRIKTDINIAKFYACGFRFELIKENFLQFLAFSLLSEIDEVLINRFVEALRFIVSQNIKYSALLHTHTSAEEFIILGKLVNERRTRIQPPILFDSIDKSDKIWRLFSKHLQYIIQDEKERNHSISRRLYEVIEAGAGSLATHALTLSVAIEGMLKMEEFNDLGEPNSQYKTEINKALERIDDLSDIDKKIRSEIKSSLKDKIDSKKSTRRKLRRLVEQGLIDKGSDEIWSKVRHSSAHAEPIDWENDLQASFDKFGKLLVLFNQLIFIVIGYVGEHTDYGCHGYPLRFFKLTAFTPLKVTMRRDEVLAIVQAHQEELIQLGVKSLDLFGSVARDEARPDSDVDFLVEFSQPGGLFQLFRVQHYLEDLLGCSIDLGTRTALREHLREPVTKDLIRVF